MNDIAYRNILIANARFKALLDMNLNIRNLPPTIRKKILDPRSKIKVRNGKLTINSLMEIIEDVIDKDIVTHKNNSTIIRSSFQFNFSEKEKDAIILALGLLLLNTKDSNQND